MTEQNAQSPHTASSPFILRLLFFGWFCFTVIFIFPTLILFAPIILIACRGRIAAAVRCGTYLFGRCTTVCARPFLKIKKIDFEKIPSDTPCILVCNHHSFADIFMCSHIPRPTAVVVVRRWPSRIPVVGWFIRMGRYAIAEDTSAKELIQSGRNALKEGYSMLFFPEGHRSRDGRIQPFQSGAFRVAADTGMPVVPVVIQGTDRLLPVGSRLPRHASVTLTALDPIAPAQFDKAKRHLRLRRNTENIFRVFLGEDTLPQSAASEEE